MGFRKDVTSVIGAILIAAAMVTTAYGQNETRQFSAKAGQAVNAALDQANSGKTKAALSNLEAAILSPDLSNYERSAIFQIIGQYNYDLDHLNAAELAFEQAVMAGGLLPDEVANTKIVIAKLMVAQGKYQEGAARLESYLNDGGELKSKYIDLLVNAWVQAKDYPRALPWAEKWFDDANPKTRAHFDLLNFLYNSLGMQGRQVDLIKEMAARGPEDEVLTGFGPLAR